MFVNVYQIQHEHFRPPNIPDRSLFFDRFMAVSKRLKAVSKQKTFMQMVRNFERLSTLEPERIKAFDSGKRFMPSYVK